MGLLALAIAPGIAICLFIYFKDKHNREPIGLLVWAFILGMLSVLPAAIFELATGKPIDHMANSTIGYIAFFAYGIVAFSEEGCKFLMLRLFIYPRKAFDEPFDGIIYAVMVGMGFATLENVGYVLQNGFANGVIRMFLSVPAHATFAIMMGYFVSLAKFGNGNKKLYFFLALLCPIIFHGTFDFFLFLNSDVLHISGALASFIIAIILSRRAIKKKQMVSQAFINGAISVMGNENLPS